MTDNKKLVEELAEIIYQEAMLYLRYELPDWVEGGNSLAQDQARDTAKQTIKLICKHKNIYMPDNNNRAYQLTKEY